jgi:hypothetical protein
VIGTPTQTGCTSVARYDFANQETTSNLGIHIIIITARPSASCRIKAQTTNI